MTIPPCTGKTSVNFWHNEVNDDTKAMTIPPCTGKTSVKFWHNEANDDTKAMTIPLLFLKNKTKKTEKVKHHGISYHFILARFR